MLIFLILIAIFTSVTPFQFGSNWMERNWESIANKTLQEITLPGTHDAGSYNLTDQLSGLPDWVEEAVKVADFFGLDVTDIINAWTKSQIFNFYEQLQQGIRYFDTRVIYSTYYSEWRTHHSVVIGNPMKTLFTNVKQFIDQFKKEVIVIELSHQTTFTDAQEKQFLDMIQSILGAHLWPPSRGFVPIQQMIDEGKNILLSLTFGSAPNIWPSTTIINTYSNTAVLSQMESYNTDQVASWAKHGIYPNQLYKISWTLTPDSDTILQSLLPWEPRTLIDLANTANTAMESWFNSHVLPKNYTYPFLANLCIIDSFQNSPIVQIVQRGLN